jgi:CubicO group peptidase (beta-lactamase class C family)
MGLTHTTYNPIAHNQNPDNIVPSIEAIDFRKTALKGYVHDEAAALNGGVAGHAGLFSNAKDLFAICQMLLNQGEYQGQRYLKAETIKTFNKRYFEKHSNRRGLGFDKPLISSPSNHCSKYCSQESFGHSGFTGTYFWIDPQNNTIFIFLSNRVYPDAKTNKLAQMNIRTDIQDLIYESLKGESKK